MAGIEIDWETLLDEIGEDTLPKRDVLPDGPYTVEVLEAEAKLSGAGNETIKLKMAVTDGPYKDRWIWTNVNFATASKVSMAITLEQLAAFGISRNYLAANKPKVAQIAAKLVGKEVGIDVGHHEYEGKTYNDVKSFSKPATDSPF
jgi:hypothetical protein